MISDCSSASLPSQWPQWLSWSVSSCSSTGAWPTLAMNELLRTSFLQGLGLQVSLCVLLRSTATLMLMVATRYLKHDDDGDDA